MLTPKSQIMKDIAERQGIPVIDMPLVSEEEAEAALREYLDKIVSDFNIEPARKGKNGKYLPRNKYKWQNKNEQYPSWVKWRHLKKAFYNMTRGAKQSELQRKMAKTSIFIV